MDKFKNTPDDNHNCLENIDTNFSLNNSSHNQINHSSMSDRTNMITSISPILSSYSNTNINHTNSKRSYKLYEKKPIKNKSSDKKQSNDELENMLNEYTFKPKINKRSEITPPR